MWKGGAAVPLPQYPYPGACGAPGRSSIHQEFQQQTQQRLSTVGFLLCNIPSLQDFGPEARGQDIHLALWRAGSSFTKHSA